MFYYWKDKIDKNAWYTVINTKVLLNLKAIFEYIVDINVIKAISLDYVQL